MATLLAAVYAGCFILAAAWLMGGDRRPRLLAALLLDALVGLAGVVAVLLLVRAGSPGVILSGHPAEASSVWVAAVLAGSASALACWLALGAREEQATTEATVAGTLGLTMVAVSLCAAAGVMVLMVAG